MKNFIKLDTQNNSLVFFVAEDGRFSVVHYGKKVLGDNFLSESALEILNANSAVWNFSASSDDLYGQPTIVSSVGDGNSMEQLLRVENEDGSFVNRFVYANHEFIEGGVTFDGLPGARKPLKTLVIRFVDEFAKLTLEQFYSVFENCDVIAVNQKITYTGKKSVKLNRMMSLQLDLFGTEYDCVSFHGAWCRERFRKETHISSGKFQVQSLSGTSSAMANPFFILKDCYSGKNFAFNFVYTGNHSEIVESHFSEGNTRVLVGINDACFEWTLKANESFVTPQAIMVCADNEREITAQMHKFAINQIVDPYFAHKNRPVLVNNWEGTAFDFNAEKLVGIAKKAVEIGAELFVLDDGWFGKRDSDRCSLGDWFDNVEKLDGGLKNVADKIRALGLDFGIWVEPEMINEDSELFRSHPEYAMVVPGREPIRKRNQLMLDLVNPEVQQYLIDEIGDVIERSGAVYVKWDSNRFMSDMYSPTLNNMGEYYHKYILGLYRIIDALKKRFPTVLFESCASGGARFDLGLLYYMPQNWCSDMTEPWHRVHIQEGTLCGYPQSAIGAHVTAWSNNTIENRFNVASLGAFGYELDLTKCSDEEIAIMKKQIEYYKKHRELLQFGQYVLLDSVFDDRKTSSWAIFSEDKSEAMVFIGETVELWNTATTKWNFTGFDDNAIYEMEVRSHFNVDEKYAYKGEVSGSVLNNCDLSFGNLFTQEQRSGLFTTNLTTRLIYFKKKA
ncbi:MAG: alpha-galactosidase [Clostridia bacterium]|nr:alpha-galactosidase [Clostridia bacterium]